MEVKRWLNNSELGIDIWHKKYQHNSESFEEWLDRISGGNAAIRQLVLEKKFLFGGRILSNRGVDAKVTLSNCYVVSPPEDNIESIFDCAKRLARTYSYGGGCGVDIGKLRPRDAKVNNSAKRTSGSVSFTDLYSKVTELIGQNGRRGALMISMPCTHPDLLDFIELKSDLSKVTKANISVRVTDEFMEAVKARAKFDLTFEVPDTGETIVKTVDAYEVFKKMCEVNWDYAEPGVLFWDRIEKWNLLSETPDFKFAGTNPCAEEPLPAGGSCLLGALNLAEFVVDGKFNFSGFAQAVDTAVVGLNEVLEEGLPLHPLEEQRRSVSDWRQIGLGIMGLGDMLIKLKIAYGSKPSLVLCANIASTMLRTAFKTSVRLGEELGSYPMFKKENVTATEFYKKNLSDIECNALRNSQLLTIAPTGSISTMLGVSGGIEPIFANYYTRKTESLHGEDKYYKVFTPIVQRYFDEIGSEPDEQLLPDYFVTAQTLDFKDRIDMQCIWQTYIDASISSTVNVPNEFTQSQVYDLYMYAYDRGLKGVTIYRDGCKRGGVLTPDTHKEQPKGLARGQVVKTSNSVFGFKRTLQTGCGTLHCTAFFDEDSGELVETYLSKGSNGGCNNFMIGLSRMISLAARGGIKIDDIVDQLKSCGTCPSYAVRSATKHDTSVGTSCPVAVGNALLDMYSQAQAREQARAEVKGQATEGQTAEAKVVSNAKCPICGQELTFEGGCNSCKACGYSKCD